MGTVSSLLTLLISFGAGVEAPDCAGACGEPAATGRWIVGLSLVIFILPLMASSPARRLLRRLVTPLARRPRRVKILPRLMG